MQGRDAEFFCSFNATCDHVQHSNARRKNALLTSRSGVLRCRDAVQTSFMRPDASCNVSASHESGVPLRRIGWSNEGDCSCALHRHEHDRTGQAGVNVRTHEIQFERDHCDHKRDSELSDSTMYRGRSDAERWILVICERVAPPPWRQGSTGQRFGFKIFLPHECDRAPEC